MKTALCEKDYQHGGNVYKVAKMLKCDVKEIVDLSSNVVPIEWINLDFNFDLKLLNFLPEPYSASLVKKIAEKYSLYEENIITSSGTTELIKEITYLFSGKKAAIISPTYIDYEKFSVLNKLKISWLFQIEEIKKDTYDIIFICNPNNPTGKLFDRESLEKIVKINTNSLFLFDESYMEFVDKEKENSFLNSKFKNIFVLRSFSKIYGIPGARAGWGFSPNKDLIKLLKKHISEWSLNILAQQICYKLLDVDVKKIREKVKNIKAWFLKELNHISNIEIFPSQTNYILMKLKKLSSNYLYEICLKNKILIRDCSNFYGLDSSFIRVSIKEKYEMKKFLDLLHDVL